MLRLTGRSLPAAARGNTFKIGLPVFKEGQMEQQTHDWKALIMKANQLFHATLHPAAAELPAEGELPSLDSATEWLNSPPWSAASLRGHVVLVDFWTYTC